MELTILKTINLIASNKLIWILINLLIFQSHTIQTMQVMNVGTIMLLWSIITWAKTLLTNYHSMETKDILYAHQILCINPFLYMDQFAVLSTQLMKNQEHMIAVKNQPHWCKLLLTKRNNKYQWVIKKHVMDVLVYKDI